jgi:hypothetical protein
MGQTAVAPAPTSSLAEGLSSAVPPLAGLVQAPMPGLQGSASMPQALMQSMGGMFGLATAPDIASEAEIDEPLVTTGEPGAGTASGTANKSASYPGAGLTRYTRPTNSFEPPASGRPTGLLHAANLPGPTLAPVARGVTMPMSQARPSGGNSENKTVNRARVIVAADSTDEP